MTLTDLLCIACSPLLLLAPLVAAADEPLPQTVQFNRDIRPLLSNNCYTCHGPDENTREADLRLDLEAAVLEHDPAVVKRGEPDNSELVRRILSTDPDEQMPPPDSRKKLSPRQIDLLKLWVKQGAKWEGHWSFIPPVRAQPPAVKDSSFVKNDIDRFVLARLKQQKLPHSAPAEKTTLARRLYFDLTGLPPTPQQVAEFVNDTSPGAVARLVEKLFASPHYGERMAMYWLDVVRYADSNGYHSDEPRKSAPYRDYVIAAFQQNTPYNQFVTDQLAGDLAENPTVDQKIASGFNMLLQTTNEGGAQEKEYLAKYSADRVRNTASIFLGTTLGCAECHDHKFDPFTQRDFYSFAAFFADIKERGRGNPPSYPVSTAAHQRELAAIDAQLQAAREKAKTGDSDPAAIEKEIKGLESHRKAVAAAKPQTLMTVTTKPRTIRLLPRGDWLNESGAEMQPATPGFLPPLEVDGRRATRLDLAKWIVDRKNPLTARAMVNRLWKLFFGHGLANPLDDLGAQGTWPTHPQLLDWLAVEFMESGWDVRHIVQLMVTSGAYQQSSRPTPAMLAADPGNKWFARQSRYRLDAEMVRDNALAVSGLLITEVGGRSVKPYQPAGYWRHMNFPRRTWQQDKGEDLYRRGLYTWWQRMFLHPSLLAFDAPTREECTTERPRSNTPQQALVLLNDPTYVEAARAFAAKIAMQPAGSDMDSSHSIRQRIEWAMMQTLSRKAEPAELKLLEGVYQQHLKAYQADAAAAKKLTTTGAAPPATGVAPAEHAAWTSVARVILNLHETITRY